MSDGFASTQATKDEGAGARFVRLFGAFGSGAPDEVEALAALYADDAVFEDPWQRIVGRAAIERAFRIFLGVSKSLRIGVLRSSVVGEDVFLTWRMRLVPRVGPAIVMEGATYARLVDGRVTLHRDYWDTVETVGLSMPLLPRMFRALGSLVRRSSAS
ncbi:MAG: nuclear transport factor 2 family protein [Polyangiales bacterium]